MSNRSAIAVRTTADLASSMLSGISEKWNGRPENGGSVRQKLETGGLGESN
jgi:hypothetical protein